MKYGSKKEEREFLDAIFAPAVDGGSSDTYMVVVNMLDQLPREAKYLDISLDSLRTVLIKLSKRWQKEIDIATR